MTGASAEREGRAADTAPGPLFSRIDLTIAGAFGLLVFVGQTAVAKVWAELGVFDQYDVIFDTDPSLWAPRMVHGWSIGNVFHPLLTYFFSVPMRIVSTAPVPLGLVDDPVAFQDAAAIYIAPLCTALKAISLYVTFRLLELGRVPSALATALGALAFSSVVFGAVPDSYAVTGLALSLVTLSAVLLYVRGTWIPAVLVLLPDVFAVGTTISNVAHAGWMRAASLWGKGWPPVRAVAVAIAYGALLLVGTVGAFYGLAALRGEEDSASRRVLIVPEFIQTFTGPPQQQLVNKLRFPEMLGRTFVPTVPGQKPNALASRDDDPIPFEFSYNAEPPGVLSVLLGLGILAAVGGGMLAAYRRGGVWRWVGLGSLASLATFAVLYTLFGINTYLYSQHWQVQALVLLAAWFLRPAMRSRLAYATVTAVLLLMFIGNVHVLRVMTAEIRAVL